MELKCSICRVQACSKEPGAKPFPAFCPASNETAALTNARQTYRSDAETQHLARSAAQVEAAGYCRWPRVQEVMEFARRIGVSHLGIATCIGLIHEAGTGLNIVVGLCVGHDSLFFRHSQAPVTVLVAKDRVTGHNPVAALYTSHSYYRRLRPDKR
jgi:uncharacterized metal-binding protein